MSLILQDYRCPICGKEEEMLRKRDDILTMPTCPVDGCEGRMEAFRGGSPKVHIKPEDRGDYGAGS